MTEPVLTPNPEVVATPIGATIVLFNPTTDRFYELQATGARLWALLAGGSTLSAVRAALLDEYDVSPGELDAELSRAVGFLTDAGLLHTTGDPDDASRPALPRDLAGDDRSLGAGR